MVGKEKLRVLFVDDEPSLCEIARAFLIDRGGYEVLSCHSVEEASRIIGAEQLDAVVCDYQMPVDDGLSLLRWVRRSKGSLPFILFTGRGREEVAIVALNEGADFYLQKGGEPRAQFAELDNMIMRAVERRRGDEALRDSERRYRLLAENAKDVIWTMDLYSRRFTYVSPSIRTLLGQGPERALAESMEDSVDPESAARLSNELASRLFRFGKDPTALEPFVTTVRQRHSDGHWVTVEISATVILGPDGAPQEVLGVSRDVSDRVLVESELRESKRTLETLMSNLPGMVYRCRNDADWTMEFVSEGCQPLTGYPASDLLLNRRLSYADIILEEDRPMVWDGVQRGLRDSTSFQLEYRIRRADGAVRYVREQGRGVVSGEGEVVALEGFIADATEAKEAMGELTLANKKLNLMGSITRHDTLNMLTVIRGQAELGKLRASDRACLDLFSSIDRQAINLQRATDFANLYQDMYSQEPTWQDMGQVIDAAIKDLPEGTRLQVSNEVDGYEVCADRMLVKVIYNLLDNTMRHGVRARRARFRCREEDGLALVYEDDGLGVPEGEKECIFERGVGRNFGYGLFFGKEILAITDMSIREEGTPGKGARFLISVPPSRFRRTGT